MPMVVVRNDITKIEADAIVNPANKRLEHGNGTSDAIFRKAGAEKLQKACEAIGTCEPGCAVATDGFNLPCKYIIHAVGPLYVDGGRGEEALLRSAYLSAMVLAGEKGCKSIAFPLLSSGNMKYPKEDAMRVALTVISEYVIQHDLLVYLVVYDSASFELSKKLFARCAITLMKNISPEILRSILMKMITSLMMICGHGNMKIVQNVTIQLMNTGSGLWPKGWRHPGRIFSRCCCG